MPVLLPEIASTLRMQSFKQGQACKVPGPASYEEVLQEESMVTGGPPFLILHALTDSQEIQEDRAHPETAASDLATPSNSSHRAEVVAENPDAIFVLLFEQQQKIVMQSPLKLPSSELIRSVMVHWMSMIKSSFSLHQDCFLQAVFIYDRFVTIVQKKMLPIDHLLISMASVVIASKLDQRSDYLRLETMIRAVGPPYTLRDLIRTERRVLRKLKFRLGKPLTSLFVSRFAAAVGACAEVEQVARYLIELAVHDVHLACCLPSRVAAAAMQLAGQATNQFGWDRELSAATSYSTRDLAECHARLASLATEVGTDDGLRYAYDEYSKLPVISAETWEFLNLGMKRAKRRRLA